MKITILNSDYNHPINPYLEKFQKEISQTYEISIVRTANELESGELLFLVSCNEKISRAKLSKFAHSIVLHASDLPKGRGWSPHIWEILNGNDEITLTMLEADDEIDAGSIYKKCTIAVPKTALWDEINDLLFSAEIDMMRYAIENYGCLSKTPQNKNVQPTYFEKRSQRDSRLDVSKTIDEQFNLMRVCDPNRFPAFFELHGTRYKLTLEKL